MQLDDRAVAVDHYGFGRFGKRFSLVAAFHSARAIHRNGNFEGHRLRPGRGIARCRRTGARAGFGSCQRVRILDDKRHRAHTCEAEFAVCPARNTFSISGLPFLSSASAEKANHSTGVPLVAKQQLFARTGANADERASFLAPGYARVLLSGRLNCSSTSTWAPVTNLLVSLAMPMTA